MLNTSLKIEMQKIMPRNTDTFFFFLNRLKGSEIQYYELFIIYPTISHTVYNNSPIR